MKRVLLIAATIAALSSGCASVASRNVLDDIDTQKVAQVERMARLSGIELQWVNYPLRKSVPQPVVEPIQPPGT